jgi:hypothetical protein
VGSLQIPSLAWTQALWELKDKMEHSRRQGKALVLRDLCKTLPWKGIVLKVIKQNSGLYCLHAGMQMCA